MSDNYMAWDGMEYPGPPPDGWSLRADGRYWPEGFGDPVAPAAPVAPPPPSAQLPPPAYSAPGAFTPPPAGPMGGPTGASTTVLYGGPSPKSSKAGWWILGIILAVIVLGVAGCAVLIAALGRGVENTAEVFDDFADDMTRRSEATQAVAIANCSVDAGQPSASGTVTNGRTAESSYLIVIDFYETETGSLLGSGEVRVDDLDPGETETWEITGSTSGIEGNIRCDRGFDTIRLQD